MTKREYWLKLFQENDTALACAVHLCERFINAEHLRNSEDFIGQKRLELDEEISEKSVEGLFPKG